MSYIIQSTEAFDRWLARLKDRKAVRAIALRLIRAENGNLGDVKGLGGGLSEMRIFVGKGYRLYFTVRQERLIILISGGDKSEQKRDIERARKLLNDLEV